MRSLHVRMTAVLLSFLFIIGGASLWLAHNSAERYFLEFTQRLNMPVAMYMAEQSSLIKESRVDPAALADLAAHVMVINPSIEVYILDTKGRVIAQAAEANRIAQPVVSMAPIEKFLTPGTNFPLYGDNPADLSEQRIFSVHPLKDNGQNIAYVYAVLAGEQHQSLLHTISASYTFKDLLMTLGAIIALGATGAGLVFFRLTRRLRRLTDTVEKRRQELPQPETAEKHTDTPSGDELDALSAAYDRMAEQLIAQNRRLDQIDRQRRELAAGISHDLRTPLTTLQGYLETLLHRQTQLDDAQLTRYLEVAHRSGKRLHRLVEQLFELSQLQSGELIVRPETFSLRELAHDSVQQYALRADHAGVTLRTVSNADDQDSLTVYADIALINRVFENLLDNALRFTPSGGRITIRLGPDVRNGVVLVRISDTGVGIELEQQKSIFRARYSSNESREAADRKHAHNEAPPRNAGLGLAIVQRILVLHGTQATVTSSPGQGATFFFRLPAAELPAVEIKERADSRVSVAS